MRVELGLILGIVFFCCWCAYIVAQMNASVSPPSSSSSANASANQLAHYANVYNSNRHYLQHQQPHDTWAPVVGEPPPPMLQTQPQAASDYALTNEPIRQQASNHNSALQSIIGAAEAQDQPLRSLIHHRASNNNNSMFGQLHYAPNHNYQPQQFARQQEASTPHIALVPAHYDQQARLVQPTFSYNQQQWPMYNQAIPAQDSASNVEDEEQTTDEEDDQQQQRQPSNDDQDQSTNSEQQDEQQEDPRQPRVELDEGSKRRSFDENESDSQERDRDGNIIKTRRRHTINGKPAPDKSGGAEQKQVPTSLTNDSDEFERLVDEIGSERSSKNDGQNNENESGDEEDQEAPSNDELKGDASSMKARDIVAAERRQDDHVTNKTRPIKTLPSEPPSAPVQIVNKSNVIKQKTKKNKPNDLHEHRMHETLSAQQWDDDSTSKSPKDGGETDDEQEAEEESRRLEKLSIDLLSNNNDQQDEPPDGDGLTRRRRRSVDVAGTVPLPAPQIDTGYGATNVSDVVHYDDEGDYTGDSDGARGSNKSNQLPRITSNFGLHPNSSAASNGSEATGTIDNRNDENIIVRTHSTPGGGVKKALDSISGQEDISIEVLANPPPSPLYPLRQPSSLVPQNLSYPYQTLPAYASYGPNYLAHGTSLPTQPVVGPPPQHQHQAMSQMNSMAANFPQIESPFASSSTKKITKKKKKKMSKGLNSKYKAAKAYDAKLKSKQKKGKMYKKKKKSHQNLKAGKKHFAGSIKGKKSSSGSGHKGADKGANFFKDKGYKKRGFKKEYHKLETGDHKTYFDEFRDKDHDKKWKKFDDKHKYSKKKKWAGKDMRHINHHKLDESKGKSSKDGQWKEKASSKHMKKSHKLKKYKKAEDSEGFKKKKKKKKVEE